LSSFTLPIHAQPTNPVLRLFPDGTKLQANINYAGDTLRKHLLDIYQPANLVSPKPLIVVIHGGGWLVNDKYADIGYMGNTMSGLIQAGYVVASIDYRFASQAKFPALIQDCNQALAYLVGHANEYRIDASRIVLMGFSAGGHLASLQGLSNNQQVPSFFANQSKQQFAIRGVVDYYGPSELTALGSSEDPKAPEAILLGATPVSRPDLSRIASPVSYVDRNDPPFLILHGEKDEIVTNRQSKLLSGWLTVQGVKNELIIVKDAPHFGKMYDTEILRDKVLGFIREVIK
jgi:acetyl esterase/lipase